ncbi:MAG: phosphatase PAP2 family protein [Candidatus Paceibacterota bacterium]
MNNQIFYFFYNLAHQSEIFDKIVIFFAVYFPYIVVILAGLFLIKKWKEFFIVFFSGVLAWILAVILKNLFHIPRPVLSLYDIHPLFTKTTFSFPSEHSMLFFAFATAIFLFHKKAGYFFMFFAFIIGISRIIAGVHFPLDIFGGFVLGALVAYFVRKFI